jgi:PadR family transcriptional regulator, regulatory protein PadR
LGRGLAYRGFADVECLHLMPQPKTTYQNRIELLQGTLDMLILKTLQWGEQHGYGISQAIRVTSGEVLQVETGSLYPALHRLERQGWVSAEWKRSESNQRAKYYRITALGKKQLASDYERWGRMVASIEGIMSAKRNEV